MTIAPAIFREIVAREPEIRQNQIEAAQRKASAALNSATGLTESDPRWLWSLKINGRAALNQPTIEQAFLEAVKNNSSDWQRFRKMDAAMPLNDDAVKSQIARSEWVILEFWLVASSVPVSYSFCYYNDVALAKLIDFLLGFSKDHYNDKSIRKVWERLGLKKSSTLLFRDVKIDGKGATPIPYDKVIQNFV